MRTNFLRSLFRVDSKIGVLLGVGLGLAVSAPLPSAEGRDFISIVGSSTVFPFSTAVAERFARSKGYQTPIVESTGTGGGLKLFCSGVGVKTPDIANASARIKPSQLALCRSNGVADVVEVAIGYDGIVLAQSLQAQPMELTLRQIYLALAQRIPNKAGTMIDNPHQFWRGIDESLPRERIEVLGPPPTSGTRVAFTEIVMDQGARTYPALKALRDKDKQAFKRAAYALREDGGYIESGENDNLIVQKLKRNPAAVGILGFNFLDQNRRLVRGIPVDSVTPEFENIASGDYPISRLLFFYVKGEHVGEINGLKEFLDFFVSEDIAGEEGVLADLGLVPLSSKEVARARKNVRDLKPLTTEDLKTNS